VKKLYIGLFLATLIVVMLWIGFIYAFPNFEPDYNIKEIGFTDNSIKLYLKSKTWGISANHEVVQLSTNSKSEIDSVHNLVFKDPDFLFYKTSHDSLFLYVYSGAIKPPQFNSTIKIIQVELPNPQMIDLYHDFKSKGLNKFE